MSDIRLTHVYANVWAYVYVHVHMHIGVCMYVCTHICACVPMCLFMRMYVRMYVSSSENIYIYIYPHASRMRHKKLVDKFTYFGGNISSTESHISIHQAKVLLWPRKGSVMKTQTQILDNRLYYTRKIELHRKGKKSRTVQITPILTCLFAAKSLNTNNGKMGKALTTGVKC